MAQKLRAGWGETGREVHGKLLLRSPCRRVPCFI